MTLRKVCGCAGLQDEGTLVSLLGMIYSCHEQETFHIDKLYPDLRFGKISRVYLFYLKNKRKCLNNFRTTLVGLDGRF